MPVSPTVWQGLLGSLAAGAMPFVISGEIVPETHREVLDMCSTCKY